MNIEKIKELYVGQEFANYRRLCEFLEEKEKGGKSRDLQIKNWQRYFSFEKRGHKLIIIDVYDEPKNKIDNRGRKKFASYKYPDLGKCNITTEQEKLKGVYKIQLDNQVYIGSTVVGFRTRYRQHCINYRDLSTHTHDLLENGASFDIMWIADENDSEATIREMEYAYIKYYTNKGYNMINSDIPVIISEKRAVVPKEKKTSKPKYTNIKINKEDYEKAIALLTENGLRIAQ